MPHTQCTRHTQTRCTRHTDSVYTPPHTTQTQRDTQTLCDTPLGLLAASWINHRLLDLPPPSWIILHLWILVYSAVCPATVQCSASPATVSVTVLPTKRTVLCYSAFLNAGSLPEPQRPLARASAYSSTRSSFYSHGLPRLLAHASAPNFSTRCGPRLAGI